MLKHSMSIRSAYDQHSIGYLGNAEKMKRQSREWLPFGEMSRPLDLVGVALDGFNA